MKRIIALFLILCMLTASAAFAEETMMEKAFLEGAAELLKSIDLQRDMLTLNVDYLGETVLNGAVRGQDNMLDIVLGVNDQQIEAQISDTDITVAVDGAAFNLQYAEVQRVIDTVTEAAAGQDSEVQKLLELGQLLVQKVILPGVQVNNKEGLHITYSATAKELLDNLAEYIDLVLAEEKYEGTLERLLMIAAAASQQQLPSLAELKEQWPMAKESLKNVDSDFSVSFDLTADAAFTAINVTGQIGDSQDLYAMAWTCTRNADQIKADGILTQTMHRGEKTYTAEINVNAEYAGGPEYDDWSLSVSGSGTNFRLTADGCRNGKSGYFNFNYTDFIRRSNCLGIQASYSFSRKGLTAMLNVQPAQSSVYVAEVLVSEKQFNISVGNYNGQKTFVLKLLADENRRLKQGYLEYAPFYRNRTTALYDGEKLIITTGGGLTITCTGAFESDHAYVLTLHAEGESVQPEEEYAYVRLEYEGGQGNFTFTGRTVGPREDEEAAKAVFACKPTEGIPSLLREEEGVISLTLETLQMMLAQ